jgi:hypothetical protein
MILDKYLEKWDCDFKEFLLGASWKMRPEIMSLIPKSAYFFSGSFV